MRLSVALLFASSVLLTGPVAAQVRAYCCDDGKGRKVCSDYLPPVCQGRAYDEINDRGFVLKRVEAPLTAEQKARREAELVKAEEDKKKAKEEQRRSLALTSTYSSPKDIDAARDRAVAEIENSMKQSQLRLEQAQARKKKLDGEREFYKGKPLPATLKAQFDENAKEIAAQTTAVSAKNLEIEETRKRFGEDKKRYIELTGKQDTEDTVEPTAPPATAPAAAAAPAAAKPAAAADKK